MANVQGVERQARRFAGLLGTGLAFLWAVGWSTGATGWLVWTDLAAALVTFGGLGPASIEDFPGVATWPCVGLVLVAAWLFGLALHATPWLLWLNFALGCAYVILTGAYLVATTGLVPMHHRHSRHA